MERHRLLLVLMVLLFHLSAEQISIDKAPKIMTDNGDLIFETTMAKSIRFKTDGGGQIRLNDIDLAAVSNELRTIRTSVDQIENLKKCNCELMNSKLDNNLIKITALENRLKTSTDQITALTTTINDVKENIQFDDCANNPCHNGGHCIDKYNSFKCLCMENFKGVHCDEDVDECVQLGGTELGCQNNARCENLEGGFRCICTPNWSGVLCNSPVNGCAGSTNVDLCGHGTCISDNTPSNPRNFKCICEIGWKIDQTTKTCIIDIDECHSGRHPCSENPFVPCSNLPGHFTCGECPAGYEGNGFQCKDINECVNLNVQICNANENCVNAIGSYKCECLQGMVRDFQGICKRENVCETRNGGCHVNAVCTMSEFTPEGRYCSCNPGFVGNGIGIDGCTPELPSNATNRSYRRCIRRQLCRNGGTCIPTSTYYRCQCLPGFSGTDCGTLEINQCNLNPCQNGGQCVFVAPNRYICHCSSFFSGRNCEIEHTECGGNIIPLREEQNISLTISQSSQLSRSFRFPCVWTIIVNNEQFIQIIPTALQLKGLCSEEYVKLEEKSALDGPVESLGMYCSSDNSRPRNFNTSGSILLIKTTLKKNLAENHGFTLKIIPTNIPIESADCCRCLNNANVMTNKTGGIFQSPDFPLKYPVNYHCIMSFEREFGETYRVDLEIKTIDLGDRISNCDNSDILKIILIESGEINITACNQEQFYNRKFVTSGFKLIFNSDSRSDSSSSRFKLTWRKSTIQDPCGGTILFNRQALIQSPTLSADIEAYCTWKVKHLAISHLVYFKGYFANWDYGDCSVYLKIINIDNNRRQTVVWETCQTQQMLTEMKEQFEGDFIVIFRKSLGVSTLPFRITMEYSCGASKDMDQLTEYQFESSNYPSNYENNLNCVYKFSAKTRKILVTFLDFDINDTYPCNSDYLEISGSNSYRGLNRRFCNGNLEELIPISKAEFSNQLVFVFKTNSSISSRGFRAKVNVYECGGSIFVKNRHYTAYPESYLNTSLQHFSHQYDNMKNCTWNFYSPPGTHMFIIFDHFHLEKHPSCRYDYLSIQYENITRVFCGNDIQTLYTTKNRLKVQFVSDISIGGEGFQFRVYVSQAKKLCHQTLEASDGVIYSPRINTLSRPYLCYYYIQVPRGRKVLINITIDGLDPFNSTGPFMHPCYGKASLKILNGNVGSPEIATICRENSPKETIMTSFNRATIIYLVPYFGSALEYNFTISFSSFDEECGSIHTDNAGQIASPNYPLYAPEHSYCKWEIRTKPGTRIKIKITHTRSGSVNETNDCNKQIPVITLVSNSKEIGINCSDHTRLPYSFDDQVVQIIFNNLYNSQYRFRLSYRKVCTYTTDKINGRIESNIMTSPFKCTWTLTGLRGSNIALEIDQFDLPPQINGTCLSYVEISDSKMKLLRKTCGYELLNRKFTTSNLPVIITHSIYQRTPLNILQAHKGFILEYQAQGCIQYMNYDPDEYSHYHVKKGTIESKNYPNAVENTDCLWNFETIPGYSVKLIFNVIELDSFLNCAEGPILKAWEDQNTPNDLVLEICDRISNGKPMIFQSSTHKLYLKFLSARDSNGGQRKFKGTYEFVNNSCEYEINLSQGIIKSPNYPSLYPHHLRCRWNLKVREGMAVHLKFTDFETENSRCGFDYVEIFSSVNNEMVKLKRLCGKMTNASNFIFESISNQMLITFHTDFSHNFKGFYATFHEGCGGLLQATDSKQFISSPNYPHVYTIPDGSCEWTLAANVSDPGSRIFFYTTGLESMTSNPLMNCSMTQNGPPDNSLTIIDGLEENNSVKAILCETLISIPVISTGHYMKIILKSTSGRAIFKASFGTGFSECGHEFYLSDGIFTSPFYPRLVNADLDCVYTIKAVPGSEIDLTFEDFSRQDNRARVFYDFIDIRYGPNETSPLVGRFYTLNELNNATSNQKFTKSLWIRLRSQPGLYTNTIRFMGRYHINYIEEFRRDKGELASPQFGHLYNSDTRMTWRIDGQTTDSLQIIFQQFSVGRKLSNGACSRGRLTITDANGKMDEFCGSSIPPKKIYSTPLRLTLYAEGYRYPGFLLSWSIPQNETHTEIDRCKFVIQATNNSQILTSPNYPNFDPNHLDCEWTIVTDIYHSLEIKMLNFTLEDSIDCKYENFTVIFYGLTMTTWGLRPIGIKRTLCGTPNMTVFDIFDEYYFYTIKITFKADHADFFPGFRLSYKLRCYRYIFNQIEGWLQNEEYPNAMSENKNCLYVLQVFGRKFQLNVTDINLPSQTNGKCDNGYLEISYQGDSKKYCGSVVPTSLKPLNTNYWFIVIKLVGDFKTYSTYSGFRLKYSLEETEECGGEHYLSLPTDFVIISSPRNGSYFSPSNIECLWKITAYDGSRFQIDFENLYIYGPCVDSYLAIYDGATPLSPKIGNVNYCSTRSSIFSTGNQLFIKFKNDVFGSRFTIRVQIGVCGGQLIKLKNVISSPNYPRNYPMKANCTWTLKTYFPSVFSARLLDLDLDNNCSKSNLTFINTEFDNEMIWNNCNQSNRVFSAPSSTVKVIFAVNTEVTRKGFQLDYKFSNLNCSGAFTDPSREIKSLNYPGYMPRYAQCVWKIKVDISKRIVILIKKLDAENSCFSIYGEKNFFYKFLCYTTRENFEIDTGTSSVKIRFKNYKNNRVLFSYNSDQPSLCGGHIRPDSNNTGIVIIKNVTSCNYIIHNFEGDEGTVFISFNFKREDCRDRNINLKAYVYSDFITDYLSVCDTPSSEYNFATSGKEVDFNFFYRRLWTQRNSSGNVEFKFKYTINRCGGLLQDSVGYIQSPNYPEKYPRFTNCEWILKAPKDMHIKLVIHRLHLESHSDCNFDYLLIRYGASFNSPVFRRFCGEHEIENETIIFRNNLLRLSFHSDYSVSKDGFLIQYTYFDSINNCNGIIHNITGSIKSPNYPRSYPSNLRCNWTVVVPEGYHIQVNFRLPFDLELAHGSVCVYDSLEIYDSNPDKHLMTICGNVPPSKPFFSSNNRIGFVFKTDFNHNLDGFHAVYKAVCGGIYNETRGKFQSPSMGFSETASTSCNYLIPSWKNHRTLLSLKGNFRRCLWTQDHLQVFLENEFGEFELYRNICGIVDVAINFEHIRSIKIQFIESSYNFHRYGMVAAYAHKSNFVIYKNITRPIPISSTGLFLPYLPNLHLLWKFEAPVGYIFYIHILEMDIQPSPNYCNYDYLAIYNSNSTNRANLANIFCGKYTDIRPIKIDSNLITIEFVSDSSHSFNHTGFSAVVYQTPGPLLGCGGTVNVTSGVNGVITSVDLDHNGQYDVNLYCEWLLSAPFGNAIQLTFENQSVQMEEREKNQCIFDSLTIYDGSNVANPVIQGICNSDQVDVVTSNSNNMLIVLESDYSITGRGFKIMYSSVLSNNHMLLTATSLSQEFSSPHYPNDTSYDFKLYANIETNQRTDHIIVEVTDLNIRSSANCSIDQLTIQDISLLYVNKIRKICKSLEVPATFISSSDKILIQYQIGPPEGFNNLANKRFKLNYRIYNCNRTEKAYSGSITNIESFKERKYEHGQICNLTLIAPREGLKYQFYFKRFQVENAADCRFDYVKFIYGKSMERQYELSKLCGNNLPASFVSNSSQVSIIFVTDTSVTGDGFDITYVINKDPQMKCGGDIELDSGAVTSPGFGKNYYEEGQCVWNIALLSAKKITWKITHLEFGQLGRLDQSCTNNSDFIKIGNETQSSKYCGKMIHPIESVFPSRTMRVEYKSTNGGTGVGFRIQWEAVEDRYT